MVAEISTMWDWDWDYLPLWVRPSAQFCLGLPWPITGVDPLWSTHVAAGSRSGLDDWRPALAGASGQPHPSAQILWKNSGGGSSWGRLWGTYLALYLQQTALKYAETGIGPGPNLHQPSVCLTFSRPSGGERISLRAIAGVVVALVGIGYPGAGAFG